MPYYYVSLAAGLIVSTIFLFFRANGANIKNLFFKTASSLCYLLTMAFAFIENPEFPVYGAFLMMGGALGLCGDIALDLKCIYHRMQTSILKPDFCFS